MFRIYILYALYYMKRMCIIGYIIIGDYNNRKSVHEDDMSRNTQIKYKLQNIFCKFSKFWYP